jgi:hypothetical protein
MLRFMVQALQDPPLCSCTAETTYFFNGSNAKEYSSSGLLLQTLLLVAVSALVKCSPVRSSNCMLNWLSSLLMDDFIAE